MKITEEWIRERLLMAEKEKRLCEDKGWKSLSAICEGETIAYQDVLFHKIESGSTLKILNRDISRWKKFLIRKLSKLIDWLGGVEDL